MHIILAIVGVLGIAAFWCWQLVERVAAADGEPSSRQLLQIAKLKERLGL